MPRELEMPDILKEDADLIHNRMLENAPEGINLVEGDFFYDATRPTAEEKAELVQVKLQHMLKLAFPQTSYGQFLEFLGEMKGAFKHPATRATGPITITGAEGTVIRKDHIIGTIATDDKPSIEFTIDNDMVIGQDGVAHGTATCTQFGIIGNVAKNTIKVLNKSISGVESITNEVEFKNGTEIEDEESFRERVLEAYRNEPLSGAKRDYIRWAKEVPGVGNVYPIPEWDGPGTVKVLILDANGKTANQELINQVQEYISPIGREGEGVAPIGALVTVDTPDIVEINITAKFVIDSNFTLENVIKNIKTQVGNYLQDIEIGGLVTFKAIDGIIGSMIIRKEGILDYSDLMVNGNTENIQLGDEVASIGEVIAL